MNRFFACFITAVLSLSAAIASADDVLPSQNGPRLINQVGPQPDLGPAGEFEPPPSPGPATDNVQPQTVPPRPPAPGLNPAPRIGTTTVQPESPVTVGRQDEAIAGIVKAQEAINQGRFDEAVRLASRSIALDPMNAEEFQKIRAEAYLKLGRFAEALADANPLEVTVTAPRAELKTKQTVLGVVTAGTRLTIDDVNGNWLKVIAAGDQVYEWAWIHQRDVRSTVGTAAQPAPQKLEYNIPSYAPMPIDPAPRGVYIYGPGGVYYNGAYGREYYDYWQHVPPAYWQFLP